MSIFSFERILQIIEVIVNLLINALDKIKVDKNDDESDEDV